MKIALTADPFLSIPPRYYGGIERIVDMLIHGLMKRGHQITLFANKSSRVPCKLVAYPEKSSISLYDSIRNMLLVTRTVIKGQYDIIHSYSRLAYLLPLLPINIPKIMTYQRHISSRSVILGNLLSRGRIHFTAVSKHMIKSVEMHGHWHVVYNGVPLTRYYFNPSVASDAPLVFLGRIEHIKGTHLAIEIAKRSGRRLIIAGNIEAEHQDYFNREIKPHLKDEHIRYIGHVDDEQKNQLLGQALALLMPILWEEPFGIVMAEALACGTPIIALKRGSVPEVIEENMSGFICQSLEEMVQAVKKIQSINRKKCRQIAERLYSDHSCVDAYETLYKKIISESHSAQ